MALAQLLIAAFQVSHNFLARNNNLLWLYPKILWVRNLSRAQWVVTYHPFRPQLRYYYWLEIRRVKGYVWRGGLEWKHEGGGGVSFPPSIATPTPAGTSTWGFLTAWLPQGNQNSFETQGTLEQLSQKVTSAEFLGQAKSVQIQNGGWRSLVHLSMKGQAGNL